MRPVERMPADVRAAGVSGTTFLAGVLNRGEGGHGGYGEPTGKPGPRGTDGYTGDDGDGKPGPRGTKESGRGAPIQAPRRLARLKRAA